MEEVIAGLSIGHFKIDGAVVVFLVAQISGQHGQGFLCRLFPFYNASQCVNGEGVALMPSSA